MRCGEKCFTIMIEDANGVKQQVSLTARTSPEARKKLRQEYGADVRIMTVSVQQASQGGER